MEKEAETEFPALSFIVRYGVILSPALTLGWVILVGYFWASGLPSFIVVFAAMATPIVYLLAKSYVELVRVIADMLLPK